MAKKDREFSQIPYVQRLQIRKNAETAAQREDAAIVALMVACVALNDTEGLGYIRLSRFAKRCSELLDLFYRNRELEEAHLHQRLRQLGFVVKNGRLYAVQDDEGNVVKKPKEAQV